MKIPFLELSFFEALIFVGLASSTAYYLVMLYGAHDFFRRYRPAPGVDAEPPVTLLRPLQGADPWLYDNLASLCRQRYRTFQLVCGVADASDPAVVVVRKLQADFPQVDIELVVDSHIYGSNYKVSNLQNMYRRAKHDLLVLADSDIRVEPDYLKKIVAQLLGSRAGLVTCLYRAVNTGGLPSLVESLFVNTDFCGMVLVARKVEHLSYAFGATIGVRREVLEKIGGFLAIADYLADDYQLGRHVYEQGYEVLLSDEIVDTVVAVPDWRTLFEHQLRWARTYRTCRPLGYFGTIFTHGTLWALAGLVYYGPTTVTGLIALALLALRYTCAAVVCRSYLRSDITLAQLGLVWIKDLFGSLVWFLAFAVDTVWWSGRRFRVFSDGRMVDLTPGAHPVETLPTRSPAVFPQHKR